MVLKLAYTIFIGLLLSLFIGVGIAAFYPQPEPPQYPETLNRSYQTIPNSTESAEMEKEQRAFDQRNQEFQKVSEEYNKNVSLMALVFAVAFLLIGLVLAKKLDIISDGLLLGGILTLIYSIIRGFGANDDIFRFVVVSIGLLVALVLGYIKFVRPLSPKK